MALGVVFPGQGSQSVGMLADLLERDEVEQCLAEASDTLGYDMRQLLSSGPEEQLNRTEYTQPAMLAAGVAVWRCWQAADGPEAAVMAGHSLGEYTALVCAGALGFADGLRLVGLRGRLMQTAVPEGEGAMAAVLGLDDADVIALCRDVAGAAVLEAVNFNAPGQVVIAGEASAVSRAVAAAGDRGARRAIPLPVSVPSHCALMEPVATELAAALAAVDFMPPAVPVIHNVDAETHTEPDAIRAALAAQVHRPVRWVDCYRRMLEAGADSMIEAGPGKVLAGLGRRIDRSVAMSPVFDSASLEKALSAAD